MAYNDCLNILKAAYKRANQPFDEKLATEFLDEYKIYEKRLSMRAEPKTMSDAVPDNQKPYFVSSYVDKDGNRVTYESSINTYEDLFFYQYQKDLDLNTRIKDRQAVITLKKSIDRNKTLENNISDFRRVYGDKEKQHELLQKQGAFTGLLNIKKKYDLIDLEADAAVGTVFDTNFTRNGTPLDTLIHTTKVNQSVPFQKRTKEILDGQEWHEWLSERENTRNFIREYNNIVKRYDRGESIKEIGATESGDVRAKDIAVEVFNLYEKMRARFEGQGIDTRQLNPFRIRVRWNVESMTKMGREAFVEDVGPRIANTIGKTLDERKALAGEIWDHMVRDKGSWYDVDNTIIRNYKSYTAEGNAYETKHLEYESGDDFLHMLDNYNPDNRVSHSIMRMIEQNSEQSALHQFFGPNVEDGFNRMVNGWKEKFGQNFEKVSDYHRAILTDSINYINEIRNPALRDVVGNAARTISTARTILAGANLGSAVVTSFLDTITQPFGGNRIFKIPGWEAFKVAFHIRPETMNPTEQKTFARFFSTFGEAELNISTDRFAMIESFRDERGLQRASSWWTHQVLSKSGLNRLTENRQQASGLTYHRYLSELARDFEWKNIDPEVQNNLIKYGLGETEWNYIRKLDNIFNTDGDIDLFDPRLQGTNGALQVNTSTLQQKWIAVVKDAVDTMVIKPSEFDKRATALFQGKDRGWANQLIRAITQFKTHPITYTRKIYMRKFFRKQAELSGKQYTHYEKLIDIAYLTSSALMMGYFVNMAKDLSKGRNPQNIVTAENRYQIFERAMLTSGALGLISDTFFTAAGSMLEQLMNEEEKVKYSKNQAIKLFVGPLLQDVYNLVEDTTGTVVTGVQALQGLDDGEYFARNVSKLGKYALHLTGAETFVYTALIYRLLVNEYLTEMIDYDGYRRKQKRLQDDADRTRGGEVNNLVYRNLARPLGID